jgi:hypothetical protein
MIPEQTMCAYLQLADQGTGWTGVVLRITEGRHNSMSDWDKVKQWVSEDGYIPKHVSMDEFIANILLQYESDLECDDCPVESWPLESWFETLVDVGCFDYK